MSNPPKLADVILDLCREAGPEKTLDPEQAARAFVAVDGRGSATAWQTYLPPVRDNVVRLALEGKLVIYRKGVPVEDPATFKGVYRFGLPASG
ncbi:DUF3253 domain-containing protein [Beijerinckia indica]|uniref:DUF3253 domain-containing protein n=1 Tax=Beijerinckia indica subsp. indica (strain ATCC 9039 / DSM 1715 / NCIMB 8712) TaxID=395963 RepID=B2IBB0_BEII9|nr:DUF3253 domain-containing protein [Beijerinckia indica]ACB95194.1 conserved hypothetical protein [Beijerinckia indica subsp. indica ATCC 9039]